MYKSFRRGKYSVDGRSTVLLVPQVVLCYSNIRTVRSGTLAPWATVTTFHRPPPSPSQYRSRHVDASLSCRR